MTNKIGNHFRKEMFLQINFKLLMITYFITKMQFSYSEYRSWVIREGMKITQVLGPT